MPSCISPRGAAHDGARDRSTVARAGRCLARAACGYADLQSQELSSWLAQDPRNRQAWEAVQAPWDALGQHAAAPGVIELRRAALAHAHNAVRSNLWPKRFRRPAIAAAAAAGLVAAGAFLFWQQSRSDAIQTGFGERRVVTLSDGSQITLDSRSEVTVRYTADARRLTLVRGQAHSTLLTMSPGHSR